MQRMFSSKSLRFRAVFMANDEPIHEAAAHQAHTYHFVWENVPAGTYLKLFQNEGG